ncbi:hypothetical protein GUJ93_ZPchr0013g37478 [Zizania palustris]|uniref:Uncharacterized protein n=1 Tax=Zizania palustris TaxID=103762 RepID=A0A8J6BXX3_ZIZPA|nr:hypothetical protein GUJ93_ZPchr0013g37478 [Zizania palustris]
MAPALQRFTDIAGDGGPRLDGASGDELVRVERAASVTTRRVVLLGEAEKGQGYAVDFLAITLHAVSRDPEAYPSPCIYTQVIGETNSPFIVSVVSCGLIGRTFVRCSAYILPLVSCFKLGVGVLQRGALN